MITDWDDAYQNGAYIAGAEDYPRQWEERAAAFRDELASERARLGMKYGKHPREALDLFLPEGPARGLLVFIHGGYWKALNRGLWSHLASGPLALGWAVAMPGYVLCPEARMSEITGQIARAVELAAGEVAGPIHLAGHSAGGHLAARMVCEDTKVSVTDRIKRVVSISGVHDLRPLLRTQMNAELRMDMAEAKRESPALCCPREGVELICWVGAEERPEFLRQNALLANIWQGCGVESRAVEEPGHHHFSVIEGLEKRDSALTRAVVGAS